MFYCTCCGNPDDVVTVSAGEESRALWDCVRDDGRRGAAPVRLTRQSLFISWHRIHVQWADMSAFTAFQQIALHCDRVTSYRAET